MGWSDMHTIMDIRFALAHHTERLVNLDGTHVSYTCACGSQWTDRLENEHTSLSSAYYAHLKAA